MTLYHRAAIVIVGLVLLVPPTRANDSFAEIAAGGIRFKKQTAVSINKEVLVISPNKVTVSYEFENTEPLPISTVVAFPIPDYAYSIWDAPPIFDDFKVKVNGQEIPVKKEIHAFLNEKEVTEVLNSLKVPIEDFNDKESTGDVSGIAKLPKETIEVLRKEGLVAEDLHPLWTDRLTYYWDQQFPAKSITRVEHSYSPVPGAEYWTYEPPTLAWTSDIRNTPDCFRSWRGNWNGDAYRLHSFVGRWWVSYILTTANNWKGPIKEFELRIVIPTGYQAMICSDLPTIKECQDGMRAKLQDYAPTHDLTVCYLYQDKGW